MDEIPAPSGPVGAMWCVLEPNQTSGIDCHDEWELVIAVSGAGEVAIGGERLAIEPGRVAVLPPGIAHQYANRSDGQNLVVASIFWTSMSEVPV